MMLKWLGGFNIAKNLFITSMQFSSDTDAGLGENESMTRIKEHPSYARNSYIVFFSMYCVRVTSYNVNFVILCKHSIKDRCT